MVLRHSDFPKQTIADMASMVRPEPGEASGHLVIAEGPPPVNEPGHDAFRLYEEAMTLKHGSSRLAIRACDIAEWMFDAGADEVVIRERFTHHNSIRNWVEAGGASQDVIDQVMELHRSASRYALHGYRAVVVGDDLLLRWRHCVVIGRWV
jgi:hypothetical protein